MVHLARAFRNLRGASSNANSANYMEGLVTAYSGTSLTINVDTTGGLGTLEELFEVLTWGQLGLHRKPCGLLNVRGFYDGLLSFVDHAVDEGFVRRENRSMLLVSSSPDALLDLLEGYAPPLVETWIDRAST